MHVALLTGHVPVDILVSVEDYCHVSIDADLCNMSLAL
jgi:hypothetical protein